MKDKPCYKWKRHALGGVKANVAAGEIIRIITENDGAVIPATIVRAAKPASSPIHACFEWDDRLAARAYREHQAEHLLRCLVVVKHVEGEEEPITVRAFVHIETDEDQGYYTTITRTLKEPELFSNVMAQAVKELTAIRLKYSNLKRLQPVWDAVDEVVNS